LKWLHNILSHMHSYLGLVVAADDDAPAGPVKLCA
jgi:hypothetical protein